MLTTGMTTSSPTTVKANKVRTQRTHAGSCWACRLLATETAWSCKIASVLMAHAPAFQPVNQHQHGEGYDQQHHRNRRRFPVGELLEARDNEDRRDLRFVRHVARHEHHRAVLPNAAGKGQRKACDKCRIKRRKDYIPKSLPARASQRGGSFL